MHNECPVLRNKHIFRFLIFITICYKCKGYMSKFMLVAISVLCLYIANENY